MDNEYVVDDDIKFSELPVEAPETVIRTIEGVTQEDIVEAIKACLKVSPLINPSNSLINTVYTVLKSMFLEDKKYVILEAPTGSGKTIIGFMTFFCVQYLQTKKNGYNYLSPNGRVTPEESLSYFLTSSKLLQEQINTDLDRFNFRDYISILKGVANYECLYFKFQCEKRNIGEYEFMSYADRPCKGLPKKDRQSRFKECDDICPYQLARTEASEKSLAVLNYAYFLNVLRTDTNIFFSPRLLTIADEAHLIPDIVCNIFNTEFTKYLANRLKKLVDTVSISYKREPYVDEIENSITLIFNTFGKSLNVPTELQVIFNEMHKIGLAISKWLDPEHPYFNEAKIINDLLEGIGEINMRREWYDDLIINRPFDIFYESELIASDNLTGLKTFKHILKDLDEARLVRENFLSKTNKCLLMSATLGDIDEYAIMMGMEEGEYIGLRLPSTFDFSKSPIYFTKSGWLNYNNFEKTIDTVLFDALKICNNFHPNEKGIIHTSTFKIADLLKQKIVGGLAVNPNRFLFYRTAEEKEYLVEMMKTSKDPLVLIGPSLYEGLDLKDDLGRFNILIKVPYAALTDYTKKKSERFPFWYKRTTLEKITQAIGRTNRHKNDYSTTYLLDSLFDKLIWELPESVTSRLVNKKLY